MFPSTSRRRFLDEGGGQRWRGMQACWKAVFRLLQLRDPAGLRWLCSGLLAFPCEIDPSWDRGSPGAGGTSCLGCGPALPHLGEVLGCGTRGSRKARHWHHSHKERTAAGEWPGAGGPGSPSSAGLPAFMMEAAPLLPAGTTPASLDGFLHTGRPRYLVSTASFPEEKQRGGRNLVL